MFSNSQFIILQTAPLSELPWALFPPVAQTVTHAFNIENYKNRWFTFGLFGFQGQRHTQSSQEKVER